jgi:hypothetical protein
MSRFRKQRLKGSVNWLKRLKTAQMWADHVRYAPTRVLHHPDSTGAISSNLA